MAQAADTTRVPYSTRLPADLVDRLRCAAPQLRAQQQIIIAKALDEYLKRNGY